MAHDLTKLEVKILEYIASQPDGVADITDIASAIPAVTDDVLQYLRYDAQYIDWIASHSTLYKLTLDGNAALERHHLAEERRIEKRAEQERREKEQAAQCKKDKKQQFRHDFLVAAFGAAVGSIITGIIDHHDELIMLIKELFGK